MSETCEYCTEPLAFRVPGIPHEADMRLCKGHAKKLGFDRPAFAVTEEPPPNINIMNFIDEKLAVDIEKGTVPVKMIYRDKLAERLGIAPKERLALTVVITGQLIAVSCLLDGGDLTPAQNEIFSEFLRETGAFEKVLGVFPERPTTS